MGSFDPVRITVEEGLDGHEYGVQGAPVAMSGARPQAESMIAGGIRIERSGEGVFVIALTGEHDLYTAPKVQEELRSVIEAGARTTIVDLSETTFLDSTMLNVFLRALHELPDDDRLLLVANNATVERIFEITGIDRFFDFYPTRGAAEADVLATARQGA